MLKKTKLIKNLTIKMHSKLREVSLAYIKKNLLF